MNVFSVTVSTGDGTLLLGGSLHSAPQHGQYKHSQGSAKTWDILTTLTAFPEIC